MDERSLIFPAAEFRARIKALQAALARAELDALLLTTAPDIFYVTGFLTRFWESPARPWYLLVPVSGAPIAVIPHIGAQLMGQCWVNDIRTWPAPDPHNDGIDLLASAIAEIVPARGKLGLPMGAETHLRMPLADYHALINATAPRRICDATDALQRVREIKSEAEIARIRTICAVANRTFARVAEFARAGVSLAKVFRDFQRVLLEEGADWVSYVAGGAGQGGYGDVISPANARPLAPGDVLMLDTGAVREGYFCDFNRNYAVGTVDDEAIRAHAALYGATEDMLETLRPGMRACDAHRAFCAALTRRGAEPLGGRLGHGLGLSLTEWPSISAHDISELRTGMVLTLEPGVQISPGRILVHEENIVLRANGPELLSQRAPAHLPELAI